MACVAAHQKRKENVRQVSRMPFSFRSLSLRSSALVSLTVPFSRRVGPSGPAYGGRRVRERRESG